MKKYLSLNVKIAIQIFLIFTVLLFINSNKLYAVFNADINHDGKVDIVDIGIIIDNYAKTPILNKAADVNGDGEVNIIDIGLVIDNYGKTSNQPTPTPPAPTGTGSPIGGVSCSSLSGIEKRFPCSALSIGSMPGDVTSGADNWDMFSNMLYDGMPGTINSHFTAVANPAGSGVVIRNQNNLNEAEKHTTVGTSRDLPLGTTECSAFRWLWKDQTEFPQRGWVLVWQLQMSGSPIVAVEVDQSTHSWFFRSRNGSDTGLAIPLGPVQYGHWAYFTACTHVDNAPNGWTKVWYKSDGWPDVNGTPSYQRAGYNSYQGTTGHNTIGIYANHDGSTTSYYGYFDRYGRAGTPQRAIQLAGN